MKLSLKNTFLILLVCFLILDNTMQSKSKLKLRSQMGSKAKKFVSTSTMLSDLWQAPGSPKSQENDAVYLKDKVDAHFNSGYSKVLAEDWLSVSSPEFKNENKFPVFHYPDGIGEALTTANDYTRINEKFKERPPYLNSSEDFVVDPDGPKQRDHFWFRLSDTYLYFAEDKKCINILNSLNYAEDVQSALRVSGHCFELQTKAGNNFKYCATEPDIMKKFLCKIQEKLRIDQDPICKGNRPEDVPKPTKPGVIEEKIITQPYILIPMARGECNENWTYRDHGKDWECLCKEGQRQSPINLPPTRKAVGSPVKALFRYEKISTYIDEDMPDKNIKAGDTLKLQYIENALRIYGPYLGKVVTMDGGVYHAQEISFHTPSEHTINGETFPMEISITHYGQTIGDTAKQVVVSFLFKRLPGVYNKFIEKLDIFNLPNPLDKFRELQKDLFLPDIFFNVNEISPDTMIPFSFYTYEGSITKPPCNENTIHYVSSEPIGISNTVIELFKEALRIPDLQAPTGQIIVNDTSILHSNRGIKSQNGRSIFYFDSKLNGCPVIKRMRGGNLKTTGGHYERKIGKVSQYFYVSGDKPSGMPGAFVVAEQEARDKGDPSLFEGKVDPDQDDREPLDKRGNIKDRRLVGDVDDNTEEE